MGNGEGAKGIFFSLLGLGQWMTDCERTKQPTKNQKRQKKRRKEEKKKRKKN